MTETSVWNRDLSVGMYVAATLLEGRDRSYTEEPLLIMAIDGPFIAVDRPMNARLYSIAMPRTMLDVRRYSFIPLSPEFVATLLKDSNSAERQPQ